MNTYYLGLDLNLPQSIKILKVKKALGFSGFGLYVELLLKLAQSEDYELSMNDYDLLAYEFRLETKYVKSLIEDFDLFMFKDDKFFCEDVKEKMQILEAKKEAGRKAGKASGEARKKKSNKRPTTVRTNAEQDKERKDNKIEENQFIEKKSDKDKKEDDNLFVTSQNLQSEDDLESFKPKTPTTRKSNSKGKGMFVLEEYIKDMELDKEITENLLSFMEVRKQKKVVTTQRAIDLIVNKLNEYDKMTQIKMIQQSIVRSYTGVFEVDGGKKVSTDYTSDKTKTTPHEKPIKVLNRKDFNDEHKFQQEIFHWTHTDKSFKVEIIK